MEPLGTVRVRLTLTVAEGRPGDPAFLFLVEVDGAPRFTLLASGFFDAQGVFTLTTYIPYGLGGHTFRLQGFARGLSGGFVDSGLETVWIRDL